MNKKNLLVKQIIIVLYLLAAAVSAIEATMQFKISGPGSIKFWIPAVIFLFAAYMYFIKKKQRLEDRQQD